MADILDFDQMFYTNFEPKLGNRFIMEIDGIQSYVIKTANRPTVTSEVVELDHINLKRKIKGKTNWEDITITLYDPIVPSGAQMVMDWVRTSHESLTGRDGYSSFYKKDITFYIIGPVGDKVEQWTLKGAWISESTPPKFDWSSEGEAMVVSMTLVYDYAILQY